MTAEHLEPIPVSQIPELEMLHQDDIHVLDYEEGNFHCVEIFSCEGSYRGYAKTRQEAIQKAVTLYEQTHSN